ncbi:hypothetical protein [uncultured Nostoc sp.]|uniref:hypothetical protein n=1 Tax=uncultured Nostoc sp. TaxID=340711 RepID=UPI0035CA16A1
MARLLARTTFDGIFDLVICHLRSLKNEFHIEDNTIAPLSQPHTAIAKSKPSSPLQAGRFYSGSFGLEARL